MLLVLPLLVSLLLLAPVRAADDDDFDPRATAAAATTAAAAGLESGDAGDDNDEEEVKRVTFLDKARECEAKCEGKRASLPECDLFCIDEPCFVRVFGSINVRLCPALHRALTRLTSLVFFPSLCFCS